MFAKMRGFSFLEMTRQLVNENIMKIIRMWLQFYGMTVFQKRY